MNNSVTLNKIAYNVSALLGNPYDDVLIERIKFEAVNIRATLIRRDLDRNGMSTEFLQSLGELELTCTDISDCTEVLSFDNVLKTKEKIPKPLRTTASDSFFYVGTIDKKKSFQESKFSDLEYTKCNKFTGNITKYVYLNERVYIINPPTDVFKWINIVSVFANPQDAGMLNTCDGTCYTDDSSFYVSEDMVATIEREIFNLFRGGQPSENPQVKINND